MAPIPRLLLLTAIANAVPFGELPPGSLEARDVSDQLVCKPNLSGPVPAFSRTLDVPRVGVDPPDISPQEHFSNPCGDLAKSGSVNATRLAKRVPHLYLDSETIGNSFRIKIEKT